MHFRLYVCLAQWKGEQIWKKCYFHWRLRHLAIETGVTFIYIFNPASFFWVYFLFSVQIFVDVVQMTIHTTTKKQRRKRAFNSLAQELNSHDEKQSALHQRNYIHSIQIGSVIFDSTLGVQSSPEPHLCFSVVQNCTHSTHITRTHTLNSLW